MKTSNVELQKIKSIDTYYNGNYFRSRLEARWAYFFDLCGVKYLYEPEGFKNNNGEMYLPDFYLPNTYLRNGMSLVEQKDEETYEDYMLRFGESIPMKGVYIEIKHEHFNESDFKATWFNKPLVLFLGQPKESIWGWEYNDMGFQIYPFWDNMMHFWICEKCKTTKIEFAEGNYNHCPECNSFCDEKLLINNARLASIIRFEHLKK